MSAIEFVAAAVVGYACGSLPAAVLVARMFKLPDPRSYGSGNPGATNVMRAGNKLAGRLVFALDFLKGLLPALAFMYAAHPGTASIAGVFAVLGHVFNPWLRFRGGRGVATGFGALLSIDWQIALGAALVWAVLFAAFRISSVASVGAFVGALVGSAVLHEYGGYPALAVATISAVIVIRHRRNMKDLLGGKERSFKKSKD